MAAYSVVVTTAGVQVLGSSGTATTLAFPTGITAVPGTPARIAVLNNRIVITGAVSKPIWLSPTLRVYPLILPQPANAPTLAAGAAGTYTGTRKAKVSFLVKDLATGQVLAESALSVESASVTVASKFIDLSSIPTSPETAVTARRIYLTSDSGDTYFAAFDIDNNTSTTYSDETSDAALSIVAAPDDLVAAPADMNLLTRWKNRIWGVSALDTLVATPAGLIDRWPNAFPIDPVGSDSRGVTGFIARRDELGICRRNLIWKMTGDDEESFALVKLVEGKGCVAPDSCIVIRDIGYFLSDDGVYTWSPEGVASITDETVKPWFTTDTYFNRSRFPYALAGYNPVTHRYVLVLSAANTTAGNRWIEFDIELKRWFGPHKTDANVNWVALGVSPDANDLLRLIFVGDDGYLYAPVPGTYTDGASTAIDFDVLGKFHAGDNPDLMHVWLQPTIFTKAESGNTLTVTPRLGDLTASAGTAQTHDLTKERERLARFGTGRLCQIEFRQNTNAQGVEFYGYMVPYITLGRR